MLVVEDEALGEPVVFLSDPDDLSGSDRAGLQQTPGMPSGWVPGAVGGLGIGVDPVGLEIIAESLNWLLTGDPVVGVGSTDAGPADNASWLIAGGGDGLRRGPHRGNPQTGIAIRRRCHASARRPGQCRQTTFARFEPRLVRSPHRRR